MLYLYRVQKVANDDFKDPRKTARDQRRDQLERKEKSLTEKTSQRSNKI